MQILVNKSTNKNTEFLKQRNEKTSNKIVVQELEVSFTLYAGMWHTTSSLLRETGYCPVLSPQGVFGERTLI